MPDDEIRAPRSSDDGDLAHALARGFIGAIPGFGSIAAEVYGYIVVPAVQARNVEWTNTVSEAINQLRKEKGIEFETLKENPAFIDTFMQVSRIAVATSDEEKRAYLRNALLNSALPDAPSATRRAMFLRLIDQFSSWHIRMLAFFVDPQAWFATNKSEMSQRFTLSSLSQLWATAYPEMKSDADLSERIWNNLASEELVRHQPFMSTHAGADGPRATKLGHNLLTFIRSPLQAVPVSER